MQSTSYIKILTLPVIMVFLGGCEVPVTDPVSIELAQKDTQDPGTQAYAGTTTPTLVTKTNEETTTPAVDPNTKILKMMEQFQAQFSTMVVMSQPQVIPESTDTNNITSMTDTTTEMTDYDDQMVLLLEMLAQMESMTSDPSSGVSVDINQLMEQFQVSMEPMMSVIPEMFAMADKGMDMMDPEKYMPEMMMMAGEMLDFSKYMVETAADLMKDPNVDHELYVNAMLRLSDDIGLMADRMLVMGDKALEMGDDMKEVALVMLDMMGDTQTNMLTSQKEFNALILELARLSNEGTTTPALDPNADMAEQFQAQLSTMIAILPESGDTTKEMADYNDQMAVLLEMSTQMQNMSTNPTSGVNVDLNQLMEQFQVSMEPMMNVIPEMFAMADKGMDMMDPEKYMPEMMMMAGEMKDFAYYMVDTTADLMKDPNVDHELYVNAMLRLSDDIGLMADRILVMGDKALEMGDDMKEVAIVMLDVMGDTQTNMIQSQKEFNTLILGLASLSNEGTKTPTVEAVKEEVAKISADQAEAEATKVKEAVKVKTVEAAEIVEKKVEEVQEKALAQVESSAAPEEVKETVEETATKVETPTEEVVPAADNNTTDKSL